jgi:hypothetical protein
MKTDINSVGVHPQLSQNGLRIDGVLVGIHGCKHSLALTQLAGLVWPVKTTNSGFVH